VEEGVLVGGGVALLRVEHVLDDLKLGDERDYGVSVLRGALDAPLRQIAINAGCEGSVVVDKVRNSEGNIGYNAATDTYEDLVAAGVIDPAKVVRNALQNAASVSGLMLTTEALIVEKPEPASASEAGGGMGGMGGMGDMGDMGGMGGMGGF
jgi:chaperonin GroEL